MKQLNYFEKLSNGLIIGSVRCLPLDPRWGRTPPSLLEAEAALGTLLPSGLRHQIDCISSIRVTVCLAMIALTPITEMLNPIPTDIEATKINPG